MNDKQAAAGSEPAAPAGEEPAATSPARPSSPASPGDPVRTLTLVVAALAAVLFGWYVVADRYTPWTDQGRVQAFVVPIASEVAGRVARVAVVQDQQVAAGDLLVEIDARDYENTALEAEAALEIAGQDIGANTEEVAAAEARLAQARTRYDFIARQAERYLKLATTGTISKADADRTRAEADSAAAEVATVQAGLDKAREQLGRAGGDNPKVRAALARLEMARRNVASTRIYAPSDGGVTNLVIDTGHYAAKGAPLMAFVSFTDVWVQADMRENSIGNVKPGDQVELVLDMAPGMVLKGEVTSKGFAVRQPSSGGTAGELANIQPASGWLRSAQRFPVVIRFKGRVPIEFLAVGGQADVQIYTGEHPLLNAIAMLRIRLMSMLSYVY